MYRVRKVSVDDAVLHWDGVVCRRHGDDAAIFLGTCGQSVPLNLP